MSLTTDPADPRLTHGPDACDRPHPQAEAYLVLPAEDRDPAAFVRPYRTAYVHDACGAVTTMAPPLAETYARNPRFYGATYCVRCGCHRPVSEFVWDADGERVGS